MVKWLTLALRVLGVWALLKAFEYTLTGFDIATGLYRPSYDYTLGGAMVHMFGFFFVGAWLLRGAPKIAGFLDAASSPETPAPNSAHDGRTSSAKEIFTTVLRIFGIWILLRMLDYWLEAFDIATKLYKPAHDTIGNCFTHIVVYFILGCYFLRGAPGIVRLVYRAEENAEQKEHEI
ncbi:MAG TPA: hypothetical protein VEP30_01340 [Chthoniobacterales bacterium]|nr:hypothetical protein [Chthoniobacterales bacterium]